MEPVVATTAQVATAATAAVASSVAGVETHGLIELFKTGGFIMYPLAAFSILTWAVALYKFVTLKAFSREYKNIYKDVQSLLSTGRLQDLHWAFKKASRTVANSHEPIFDETLEEREDYNEKINRRLDSANSDLRAGLWILGSIASSAPFVGLFGTVVGIMESFKSIGGSGGKGGFGVVSAGISEALVATAAGIGIAVLSLLLFNYFQVSVQNMFHDYKNKVEDLAQTLFILRSREAMKEISSELPPNVHPIKEPQTMSSKFKGLIKNKEVANGR